MPTVEDNAVTSPRLIIEALRDERDAALAEILDVINRSPGNLTAGVRYGSEQGSTALRGRLRSAFDF